MIELPTGRRVVVDAFGETPLEAIAKHLRIEDQPAPTDLGPGEVLVAVRSAAVGWVDLLMTSGQYQHMATPPYTPGLEFAGEIAAVGSEVADLAVGTRVVVDPFVVGPRTSGPYRVWGGFASWAVAPREGVFPLPDRLGFDEAANLLGNYETAYFCLLTRGRLQAGETVLVLGATGSTGLAAVTIAKQVGAQVIAAGRSAEKLEAVAEEGADHLLVTVDEHGELRPFRDDLKALTGGRGVDVIYDPVGGDVSVEALKGAAFGGRFVLVGWASTPFVARGKGQRGAPRANQLPTNLIMMKGLDVLGSPTVITTARDPSLRPPRLEQIWKWLEGGAIRPRVGPGYDLEDVVEAMKAKWESRFVGGCVLHPPKL
ncbi:MAG: NADPH:quinone oxidoreductase family protein [Polyangiaceae bacterium]